MNHNLIFWGLEEHQGENCAQLVNQFLAQELDLPGIKIDNAHRLGPVIHGRSHGLICRFVLVSEKSLILQRCNRLRGTPYSVTEQVPAEVHERRAPLYQERKSLRDDGKQAVVRGDRLIVENEIVRDIRKELAACSPVNVDSQNTLSAQYKPMITQSSKITKKKSTFMSCFVPITQQCHVEAGLAAVRTLPGVASATHNICALALDDGTKLCHDDGEHKAGRMVLNQLIASEKKGLLVVNRWYGGEHLGPDRFKIIKDIATKVL